MKHQRLMLIFTIISVLVLALTSCTNPQVPAAEDASESTEGGEVEVEVAAAESTDDMALSGDIVISFQSKDTQTWEAICEAYTAMHPDVNCRVEMKPSEGYQEFIRTQFAAGEPEFSLVWANVVADLINAKAFLDMSAYLDRTSPYSNRPWREDFDQVGLSNMIDPLTGELFMLNIETVQVLWFYNKALFEQAGILEEAQAVAATPNNQPTWDQFIGWCDALTEADIIPVAIEGDFRSFWEMRIGWLVRTYADQFTRDEAELVRCQPGDYCYREGVDDVWVYDPADPGNDDRTAITFNPVRKLIALRDGEQTVNDQAWREMYTKFKDFGERCTPPGWIGTADAYPLFLTEQAAIKLDGAWLISQFEKDIRSLAEGTYESGEETLQAAAEVFELGTFNYPTMEGGEVDATARTIEVNIGFWGIPKKDVAQNDLEVDFLMFVTSPQGAGLYLDNKLDPENLQGGVLGPLALNDVELPPDLAARFDGIRLIGNVEKDTAGVYRSRGVNDYQPSVREWVDLAHQYFLDEITLDEFLDSYQESLLNNFDGILEHMNIVPEDLEDPSRKPVNF
ncbi:MAG: extracellular solute-binding protein [Chloroflexota bacterium]